MSDAPRQGLSVWKMGVLGLASGCLSALLGVGGGILLVPALVGWLKLPMKRAVGTSLVAVLGLSAVSVALEMAQGPSRILWLHAGLATLGALAGVKLGRKIQPYVPDRALRLVFSGLLILAGLKFVGVLPNPSGGDRGLMEAALAGLGWQEGGLGFYGLMFGFASVLGLVGGLASALLGIGGGVVYVPGLALLFGAFASPDHPPRATSLAVILLGTMAASWSHYRAGNVEKSVVFAVFPTGIVGAGAGVALAAMLDPSAFRKVFAVLLFLVALQMLVATVRRPAQARKP